MTGKSTPLSLLQFVQYLCPVLVSEDSRTIHPPTWPGDLFAICAALLEKSGAYSALSPPTWIEEGDEWNGQLQIRTESLRKIARKWREEWRPQEATRYLPDEVRKWWEEAMGDPGAVIVANLADSRVRIRHLVNLLAVADESLAGVGLQMSHPECEEDFWFHAEFDLLRPFEGEFESSTLCENIHPTRIRVLPKSQTPVSGLSLRSLSHHLSFCPPADISTKWWTFSANTPEANEHANILLIPWPFEVLPSQFRAMEPSTPRESLPPDVGWFTYEPPAVSPEDLTKMVLDFIDESERKVGTVHMVVMPETSLTGEQHECIASAVSKRDITFIAGVIKDVPQSNLKDNIATINLPNPSERPLSYEQKKHHRWRLDGQQIVRYDIGAALSPEKCWWEGIDVSDREINFLRFREWLSVCVLVCEDLARLDPVGRIVRSVGPDLVVALLMDGPQLPHRWPGHYATVLADDPGSSVLTLTSLGMTQISQPVEMIGQSMRQVIAMWRDPVTGTVPIELPANKIAAVLTTCRKFTNEITADGRDHQLKLGAPIFGGIHFLDPPSKLPVES